MPEFSSSQNLQQRKGGTYVDVRYEQRGRCSIKNGYIRHLSP